MAVFLPPLWILAIFSNQIVGLLFDARYQGTSWILHIFSISFIPIIIAGLGSFYLALGDSAILVRLTLVKAIIYFSSILIGWLINGSTGMIYGMAASNVLLYFSDVYAQNRYSIWLPKLDVLGFVISAIVLSLGSYLI